MIKNLSLEFIQLRNIQTITCEVYLNCDYLRKHLSQLDKNIAVYKNLINYDNLPSFKENVKNKEKIKDIKAHIETSFNNIHTEIKQFTIQIENKIISDTIRHPFTGLGKPEPLQHNLSGFWSRKLNSEYRMAYGVTSKEIQIIQLKYHSL